MSSANFSNFGNLNNPDEDAQFQELLRIAQNDPDKLRKEYEKLLKQNKPMTSEEFLDPKYDMQLDHEGGIVVEPKQAFVMKSHDISTKEKFFVNVVTHPIIDEPEEKNFVDYNNERGIRLPMSVGRIKEDFDKNKNPSKVVDVILHPKVVATLKKDNNALLFFYQLVNNYLQQKYKIELEETFNMPKLPYKGSSVEFQRVKGKKAPKIETLDTDEVEGAAQQEEAFKNTFQSGPAMQAIEWKLLLEFDDGVIEEFDGLNEHLERVQKIHIEYHLPLLVTGKNIGLKLSEDEVEISAGKIYQMILKPIILIDPSTAKAIFDIKTRTLNVQVGKLKKVAKKDEGAESQVNERAAEIKAPELSNELLFDVV